MARYTETNQKTTIDFNIHQYQDKNRNIPSTKENTYMLEIGQVLHPGSKLKENPTKEIRVLLTKILSIENVTVKNINENEEKNDLTELTNLTAQMEIPEEDKNIEPYYKDRFITINKNSKTKSLRYMIKIKIKDNTFYIFKNDDITVEWLKSNRIYL